MCQMLTYLLPMEGAALQVLGYKSRNRCLTEKDFNFVP